MDQIRIRILNPDPATQINADPDTKPWKLSLLMTDLEFPGHSECEALVRDVVPLVGKVEPPDVHHQLTLHVLHVVMQRRDEMPDTRETCRNYIKGFPLIVQHPVFLIRIRSGQKFLIQEWKNDPQNRGKKEISFFKMLAVRSWGLKSSLAWTSFMKAKGWVNCNWSKKYLKFYSRISSGSGFSLKCWSGSGSNENRYGPETLPPSAFAFPTECHLAMFRTYLAMKK